MRWLTFAVCASAGIIAQTTLAGRLAFFGVKPDWMLVLTVFFALYSSRRDAVLAGWILGLLVDMTSVERAGLTSAGFALTALLVNAIRHLVFLKNVVTHFMVTLGAAFVLRTALAGVHIALYPRLAVGWQALVLAGSANCLSSAVWALPVCHGLLKCTKVLRLDTSCYAHGGLVPADVRHV